MRNHGSLREYLERETKGIASSTGAFGKKARPLSVIEDFQIEGMAQGITREEIINKLHLYYSQKWRDGVEDCGHHINFYYLNKLPGEINVRVILMMSQERPNYCRVCTERISD